MTIRFEPKELLTALKLNAALDEAALDAATVEASVAAAVASGAVRAATLAALQAITPAAGTVGEVYAEPANNGQYRYLGGAWVLESRATLASLNEATAGLNVRTSKLEGEIAPRVGTLSRMTVQPDGRLQDRRSIDNGDEVPVAGVMQPVAAVLNDLTTRANMVGVQVPRVSSYASMRVATDGKVIAVDTPTGDLQGDGAALVSLPGEIVTLRQRAPQLVPRAGTLAYGVFADNGLILSGVQADGQPVYRNDAGTLKVGIDVGAFPRITFTDNNGWTRPSSDVDVILLSYGQSYARAFARDYLTATATWGNLSDITGCWMPSVGVHPDASVFSSLVPLRNLGTALAPIDVGEPPAIEMGRTVREEWVAAGLTDLPRIIVLGDGAGGQPIQTLMRGGVYYNELMTNLETVCALSRAAGKRPVVYSVMYLQGEANRSGAEFATTAAWVQWLSTLQAHFEADCQAITGQTERVMLVTTSVTRNNQPATVSLGAVEAELRNPGRIICAGPNYAVEHGNESHPDLVGFRRLGRYVGQSIARAVLGHERRMCRVANWWLASDTELRFDVDLPMGGTAMVLDTTGAIVNMTGMDAGRGWVAFDRAGAVTISSVAVSAGNHPAGPSGNSGGTTCSITFARSVHEGSLRCNYANGSANIGGGLGGSVDGPRGCFRANDAYTVPNTPGMPNDIHSWLMPAELT